MLCQHKCTLVLECRERQCEKKREKDKDGGGEGKQHKGICAVDAIVNCRLDAVRLFVFTHIYIYPPSFSLDC